MTLLLDRNALTSFPAQVGAIRTLSLLDVRHNQIIELPSTLRRRQPPAPQDKTSERASSTSNRRRSTSFERVAHATPAAAAAPATLHIRSSPGVRFEDEGELGALSVNLSTWGHPPRGEGSDAPPASGALAKRAEQRRRASRASRTSVASASNAPSADGAASGGGGGRAAAPGHMIAHDSETATPGPPGIWAPREDARWADGEEY